MGRVKRKTGGGNRADGVRSGRGGHLLVLEGDKAAHVPFAAPAAVGG